MHKIGQVSIFVQLLMEINFEQLRTKTVLKQINVCLCTLNLNYVTDITIKLILKFKQYQNATIVNFVHYGKTRVWVWSSW